jgi:hypothetical protein
MFFSRSRLTAIVSVLMLFAANTATFAAPSAHFGAKAGSACCSTIVGDP